MNQEEIKKILPHRDHMLLIDEAELREGKAYGKKTIRGDEFFLQGHFPGNPVVPGVILCEILGQSACVLLSGEAEGITPFFTGLDKVRFKNPVHPGDVFETECTLLKHKGPFYWAEGKGYVEALAFDEAYRSFFGVFVLIRFHRISLQEKRCLHGYCHPRKHLLYRLGKITF